MLVVLESGDEKVNGTSKSDVLLIAADPKPKFVLAEALVVAPVPPYATAKVDPFQVPDVIVPTPVKLEEVMVDFKVVPDNVPASAITVISALPLNAVPLIFLEVANVVAVLALPVKLPMILLLKVFAPAIFCAPVEINPGLDSFAAANVNDVPLIVPPAEYAVVVV